MSDNKTYLQMRKDFQEIYRTKIIPAVRKFEPERLKLKRKQFYVTLGFFILFSILSTIFLVPLFISLLIVCLGVMNSKWLFLFISFLLLAGAFKLSTLLAVAYGDSIKKKFENKIKKIIMPYFCESFDNLTWSASSLYDDRFVGSYKDVNFEIGEGSRNSNPQKDTYNVYNPLSTPISGRISITLRMNKKAKCTGFITTKNLFANAVVPQIGIRLTKLEDVDFGSKYDVFTNDEIELRYIVTPSFMESLSNIKTVFKTGPLECFFCDNFLRLDLASNKDLFSICSLSKSLDDINQFYMMYEEIISIIKFIDSFNFDRKLGL